MATQILDACCGPRMFWFDKNDKRALFMDEREEDHDLAGKGWTRKFSIRPDVVADFRDMPFPDNSFRLVVFDPPHITRVNQSHGFMVKKYGRLAPGWEEMIRKGFSECFRVLEPYGILIFKWSETDVSTAKALELTPEKPLFGSRIGKYNRTHWIVFMKNAPGEAGKDGGR